MDVLLSDNLKRRFCRAGFVALCVLPTLLCAQLVLFPMSNRDWSHRIQMQFGVFGEVAEVRPWMPGQTGLIRMQVGGNRFDSRFDMDQAVLTADDQGSLLEVANARGSVAAFWRMLDQCLDFESASNAVSKIRFESVQFVQTDLPTPPTSTWHQVTVEIDRQSGSLVVEAGADGKAEATREPAAMLRIERTREDGRLSWSVDGMGQRIPAWVLKPIAPVLGSTNPHSMIANLQMAMIQENEKWSGTASGQLSGVDLEKVIGSRFGLTLTGMASLNIETLTLSNNRITSLQGDVYSPQGAIGSRLLQAAMHTMGLQLVEPYGRSPQENYTDLRFGFRLVRDQVAIVGMKSGAVLKDPDGHLMMMVAQGKNQPVSGLLELVSWPLDRMPLPAVGLARHLITSPVTLGEIEARERTARNAPVGTGSFFNR